MALRRRKHQGVGQAEMLIQRPDENKTDIDLLNKAVDGHQRDLSTFCEHVGVYTMIEPIDVESDWKAIKHTIERLGYTVWLVTQYTDGIHPEVIFERKTKYRRGRVILDKFVDDLYRERLLSAT